MTYKHIRTKYLDSVSGGDTDIILEIYEMFREQSGEIYNEMKSYLSQGDYKSLGLLAHKAKSSVSILGMDEMAKTLKIFEQQAKEGKGSELYESYIEKFRQETEGALSELKDFISNIK